MKVQSITSTDQNTIKLKAIELKGKGFRVIVNENDMEIGTYYRSENLHSNPRMFEGPPNYTIKWSVS